MSRKSKEWILCNLCGAAADQRVVGRLSLSAMVVIAVLPFKRMAF